MGNDKKDFKLLLTAVFPPGAPGGDWVLIKHLLRHFNWNRLCWWSMFGKISDHTTLGNRAVSFDAPGRLMPMRRLRTLKGLIFEALIVPLAARHLRRFIQREKPDVLWLISFGWSIPVLYRVVPRLGIPWHISIHDMPDHAGMAGVLGAKRAARFVRMQEVLYQKAASRNVVCEGLGVEMERTTGVAADFALRCSVEPEAMAALAARPLPSALPAVIRIAYAGTIIAEEAFALFVAALQAIREQLPRPVEIHLFSAHSYKDRSWFDPSLIVDHGLLSHADLQKPYGECTWGLAIMQMHDNDPRYNRMSFPCKFTQTLAAGLPLICLGHPESSLMHMARQYRLGLVFDREDVPQLAEMLLRGLPDLSRFSEYRREILRCTESEFSAERFRDNLFRAFNSHVAPPR